MREREKKRIGGIWTKERERERARYHTTWAEFTARARDEAWRYLLCSLPCSLRASGVVLGQMRGLNG